MCKILDQSILNLALGFRHYLLGLKIVSKKKLVVELYRAPKSIM